MDNREKEIREEVEAELALIKTDPWRSQPTIKFKLEDVCALLSLIDNLRAERDELKRKYTQTVAQWQVRAERAEAGEGEEIDKRMKIAWQLDEIREAWEETIADLKRQSERAYCESLDIAGSTKCLGWQAKVDNNKFGIVEMEGHRKHNNLMGRHQGLAKALGDLRKLAKLIKEKS